MSHAETSPEGGVPRWITDGLRQVQDELLFFFRTAAAITVHPRQFAREWATGQRRALNPLAFLATSLGFTSPLHFILQRIVEHRHQEGPAWVEMLEPFLPYGEFLLLGVLCHAVLRVSGAVQPLRATVAISLFAGGGPAAAADVFTDLLCAVIISRGAEESLTAGSLQMLAAASIIAANAVFIATFAQGLAGLHQMRLWRSGVALLLAYATLVLARIALFTVILQGEA